MFLLILREPYNNKASNLFSMNFTISVANKIISYIAVFGKRAVTGGIFRSKMEFLSALGGAI